MTQTPPRLDQLPLWSGQKALLGASAALLVASALVLWQYVPRLPARIPTHWGGASTPDSFGPPSTLWGLWALMLGLWAVFGLFAWQIPKGKIRLNGMPPVTEQHAPHIYRELRSMVLLFQLILMVMLFSTLSNTVIYALGGPNMMGLTVFLIALFPLSIGYSLYRIYYLKPPD
jgi:uncharacterized membrane protein